METDTTELRQKQRRRGGRWRGASLLQLTLAGVNYLGPIPRIILSPVFITWGMDNIDYVNVRFT